MLGSGYNMNLNILDGNKVFAIADPIIKKDSANTVTLLYSGIVSTLFF